MNEFRDLKNTVLESQQRMEAESQQRMETLMNTVIESQQRMEAVLARVEMCLNEFTR
jgi:hypothetical protein